MALLSDVERIAVVGAEGDERRVALGHDRAQRVQVLAHRALPDQHRHALHQLFARLGQVRHLVIRADAGAQIPVQRIAAEQRAMPVDRAGLERGELGETGRIAGQKAAEVHELGEAQHLRVIGQRKEVADLEPGARRLEVRRGNAARKLNPKVHRGRHGAVEEVAQARRTEDVADLMRIADRRRDSMPQDAAVELERRDERRLDMAMRIDEARNDDLSPHVDLARAAVFAHRSDDAVAADGDVARDEFAGHEIEDPPSLEDDVGLGEPLAPLDRARKIGDCVAHGRIPVEAAAIVSALAGLLKQEFPHPRRAMRSGRARRVCRGQMDSRAATSWLPATLIAGPAAGGTSCGSIVKPCPFGLRTIGARRRATAREVRRPSGNP